jgi:hypothetical protein
MTNTPDPTPSEGDNLVRKVRDIDWRVRRLEASQMPASAIDDSFERVYIELDDLQDRSDLTRADIVHLEGKIDTGIARLEGKLDTILQHLTGYQGQ